MKKIFIIVLVVIVVVIAYWLISPIWRVTRVDEIAPVSKQTISTNDSINKTKSISEISGTFVNGAHDVSGIAKILDTEQGKILRFENFKTINGPDLFIYLATDTTAKEYVNIGAIKGTEGNINYTLPADIDLKKYNHVLVWCRAFSVLFGEALLK